MHSEWTIPSENEYEKCYRQITRCVQSKNKSQEKILPTNLSEFWISPESGFYQRDSNQVHLINLLIVDDHDVMFSIVSMVLDDYENIQCYYAESLEEMWKQLECCNIHTLLLDVHLPDGNGLSEIHQIRRLYPNIRIVPLTIENDPDYVATNTFWSVDGWVPKGLKFRQSLLRVLNRLHQNGSECGVQTFSMASHISDIEIVFYSSNHTISRCTEQYLQAVVSTLPLLPDQEARYQASQLLGISPTSLKDAHKKVWMPSFTTLQRSLCASLAIIQMWKHTEYSLEQVTDSICRYCVRSIERAVENIFNIRLARIRQLPSLNAVVADSPIPISFMTLAGQGDMKSTIRIVVRI